LTKEFHLFNIYMGD